MNLVWHDDVSDQIRVASGARSQDYAPRSLVAVANGTWVAIQRRNASENILAADVSQFGDQTGSGFDSVDDLMAYLAGEFGKKLTQRNYALAVSDGQTTFPISPSPSDVNTINLAINGVLYAPPDIAVSATTVTWQGPFGLSAEDAVRAIYC